MCLSSIGKLGTHNADGPGVGGQHFKSAGNFMNCRENREIFFYPPPGGNFRGSKNQKSGKCHERPRKVIQNVTPTQPHPTPSDGGRIPGGGGVRVEHFKVTKHQVLKSISIMQVSCANITLHIFGANAGRSYSEGGRLERSSK